MLTAVASGAGGCGSNVLHSPAFLAGDARAVYLGDGPELCDEVNKPNQVQGNCCPLFLNTDFVCVFNGPAEPPPKGFEMVGDWDGDGFVTLADWMVLVVVASDCQVCAKLFCLCNE